MKNILLIMNPKSGTAKGRTCLFDIVEILSNAGMRITVELTKYAKHATELCENISDEFDGIVCFGGDGTLNEAITGLIRGKKNIPIGYIPGGSTNDFGNTLGLSRDVKKATRDITNGITKKLDIGRFNNRFFSYVASFGMFTKTSYSTSQEIKNALGHLAYVLEGMKELSSIRTQKIRLETDDGTVFEDNYIFGAIANSTSIGGVISLKKHAIAMNDGYFELMLVKQPKNVVELNSCINSILTQNYKTGIIDFYSIKKAKITLFEDMTWSLDGERADTKKGSVLTVENLNGAVNVILPKHSDPDLVMDIPEGEINIG